MAPHTIITAAEWTLTAETAEGAPQAIFSAVCLTCGAEAQPVDGERLPVEVWALKHTGLHPTHRQFKAVTECFWRVDPAPSNPYRETESRGARP
ncbi:hypothetical protein SLUN_19260 [Streptomyces lunaelactis]|uniref:DUF7848 domain-containing protein n=1 Tax=Streptomyces lunaelactis TaxID=1535768 RepID=A0A2R4T4F1_9ACTN|nr:hypothetical protein SLUN_19260 [Streptomyces lunaelactis]